MLLAPLPLRLLPLVLTGLALARGGSGEGPGFDREVRPILSDRCFRCHGPDAGSRKRGLRLDTEEGSRAELRGGGHAIVPGDVEASEALRRILATDEDEVMPPPELGRPLSEAQKALLVRWVEAGARYERHWAFVPPRAGEPPAVAHPEWCRDPLDRYVLARLESEGLEPAPAAERGPLARRIAMVLTGLPPSEAELADFERAESPDAERAWIERLLASPRAAEHQAAAWLDLARFADTFGYQADWESHAWPWRDWLIRALQANEPYDRFVRELVAGDSLVGATRETRLATAFLRLHRMTNEGGSIDAEFRQEAVSDRVATLGTALLGLTVECARCHDHKYDPIGQVEYYSLCAFLGDIDEAGTYPYTTGATPRPALRLPTPEQERAEASAAAAAGEAERGYLEEEQRARARFAGWLAVEPRLELPAPARSEALDGELERDEGRATGLDGDTGPHFADFPPFQRSEPLSLRLFVLCPDTKSRAVVLHTSSFTIESDAQGYQLLLEDGRIAWQIVHYWPGSAIAIESVEPFPLARWVELVATYDGSSRAAGLALYLDGEPLATRVVRDHLDGPATTRSLELGYRSRDLGLKGGGVDELALYEFALTPLEVAELRRPGSFARALAAAAVDEAARTGLEQLYLERVDPLLAEARATRRAARRVYHAALECQREIMVMEAGAQRRQQHVLKRGAYDQPDLTRPVAADRVLPELLAYDPAWPRNRAGLAEWLCDPANPLLARVEVNRLWAQVFGTGLVATQENFGAQGEAPSHPELLDRLAIDFVASGWDVRDMLARLVGSATFRQSSRASAAAIERDPENRLLARGPGFRWSAEVLRDQALCLAGLLHEQIGGPSVKPWQPPGLWEEAGVNAQGNGGYVPDSGPAAHRRSLYTYRKRTAPPPNMLCFDAGSREQCLARRQPTSTPLQYLVLWNDPVFLECAIAMAGRVLHEAGPGFDERLAWLYRQVAARAPREREHAELEALHAQTLARYAATEAEVLNLLPGLPPDPELAAWTILVSTVLSTDAATHCR